MDHRLKTWIHELRRFNGKLHLMGPAMLDNIEEEVEVMMPLLELIDEPVLADLGSGSGLPVIPYKILHPDSYVFLIERSVKKCTFLQHVIGVLGLEEVEIISQDPMKVAIGPFDAVIARSFSPLTTLREACLRIIKDNGKLYYLYTGITPELQPFTLEDVRTQIRGKLSLNLAIFSRHPG
ncbi:MAG TPA: RsmG family class I SAM-dependent methyltransferase [Desulfomonilia bacterium]|nr:RsmG family class I SAM-dependent methyltransferase [Desulfomonilia bacterium]